MLFTWILKINHLPTAWVCCHAVVVVVATMFHALYWHYHLCNVTSIEFKTMGNCMLSWTDKEAHSYKSYLGVFVLCLCYLYPLFTHYHLLFVAAFWLFLWLQWHFSLEKLIAKLKEKNQVGEWEWQKGSGDNKLKLSWKIQEKNKPLNDWTKGQCIYDIVHIFLFTHSV